MSIEKRSVMSLLMVSFVGIATANLVGCSDSVGPAASPTAQMLITADSASGAVEKLIPENREVLRRAMAVQNTSPSLETLKVMRLYQALYDASPSTREYNDWQAKLKALGEGAFTKDVTISWNTAPNARLAELVLNNMSVTSSTVQLDLYKQIVAVLTQIFSEVPRDLRGQVILNVTSLLAGLTTDPSWGVAASSFNQQVQRNVAYINAGLLNGQELQAKNVPEFHDLGGVVQFSASLPSFGSALDLNSMRQCPTARDYGGTILTPVCNLENVAFKSSDNKLSVLVDFKDYPESPSSSLRTSIGISFYANEEVLLRNNRTVDLLTGKVKITPIYGTLITKFETRSCSITADTKGYNTSDCDAKGVSFNRESGQIIFSNAPVFGSRWNSDIVYQTISPDKATVSGRVYVLNEVVKYGGPDAANYREATMAISTANPTISLKTCTAPDIKVNVGPCFEQYKQVELKLACNDTSTPLKYDQWAYDSSVATVALYQCLATNSLGKFQDIYIGRLKEAQDRQKASAEALKRDTVCPSGYSSFGGSGGIGGLVCQSPSGETCMPGSCPGLTSKDAYKATLDSLSTAAATAAASACKLEAEKDGYADDIQYDSFCRIASFDACLHRAGYPQYDKEGTWACVILDDLVKTTGVKRACRTCNPTYPYPSSE